MTYNHLSLDRIMLQAQRNLIIDLIDFHSVQKNALASIDAGIKTWRIHKGLPCYSNADHYTFKCLYQVENFLKRYLFTEDLHDEHSLTATAQRDFIESQKAFGLPRPIDRASAKVIEEARSICHKILGDFDHQRFAELCRFGTGASKGLTLKKAYLDLRLEEPTGTPEQIDWFKTFLYEDEQLCHSWSGKFNPVQSVDYTVVPKSYKAMRGIAPDTILGGFLSQGVGRLLRERLEANTHINLSYAQECHKSLALKGSKTGHIATLDMSKASDSFTWDHIDALVPLTWLPVLKAIRTPNVCVDSEVLPLKSYMLMGSGHTFPLQTILFYSLVKATCNLLKPKNSVWVFGDDIICPTSCATYVATVLGRLGFTLNLDKSFLSGSFRESCGGDYYNGFDVRPAMPKLANKLNGKRSAISYLFRVVNSLLERWSEWEIPTTINALCDAIYQLHGSVPQGIAGVFGKDSCVLYDLTIYPLTKYKIVNDGFVRCVEQRVLIPMTPRRMRKHEKTHYWDALRQGFTSYEASYNWEVDDEVRPIGQEKAGSEFPASDSRKGAGTRLQWRRVKRPF